MAWIAQDMPGARSGKIMRRIPGDISHKNDVGDGATRANPEIMEGLNKW
jgi:hypothetical protein